MGRQDLSLSLGIVKLIPVTLVMGGSVDYIFCGENEAIFKNISRQIVETSFFLFHTMLRGRFNKKEARINEELYKYKGFYVNI
jgi:hypothetical protein